jgi:hypothetical protein
VWHSLQKRVQQGMADTTLLHKENVLLKPVGSGLYGRVCEIWS